MQNKIKSLTEKFELACPLGISLSFIMQALLNDFRTFDWAKEVPYPAVMLAQIKEFLN